MRITPRQPLPSFDAYTIDAALADKLAEVIERHKPNFVVECGSGLSTLCIGYALEATGKGHSLSIDHHSMYAERTREWVELHKLAEICRVICAPIHRVLIPFDGMKYHWYDIPERITETIDLLFVDGPPGDICTLSRWPAYWVFKDLLADDAVIILDDGRRKQEQQIVKHWTTEDKSLTAIRLATERSAYMLERIRSDANTQG